MSRDFAAHTAEYYARHRLGYPDAVLDRLVADLGLDRQATVLDLGCGTGLLSSALAARVRVVLGADPEPDMLRLAAAGGTGNVLWLLAADRDLPALGAVLRPDAVTVAQALHLMDLDTVLTGTAALLPPGGRIAVIANGLPLWQQDTSWSRTLLRHVRARLGEHSGQATCGTSAADRARYRDRLVAAGWTGITESSVEYTVERSVDDLVGGLYSALDPNTVRTLADSDFERDLRADLEPVTEHVRVHLLSATRPD